MYEDEDPSDTWLTGYVGYVMLCIGGLSMWLLDGIGLKSLGALICVLGGYILMNVATEVRVDITKLPTFHYLGVVLVGNIIPGGSVDVSIYTNFASMEDHVTRIDHHVQSLYVGNRLGSRLNRGDQVLIFKDPETEALSWATLEEVRQKKVKVRYTDALRRVLRNPRLL